MEHLKLFLYIRNITDGLIFWKQFCK